MLGHTACCVIEVNEAKTTHTQVTGERCPHLEPPGSSPVAVSCKQKDIRHFLLQSEQHDPCTSKVLLLVLLTGRGGGGGGLRVGGVRGAAGSDHRHISTHTLA